MSALALTRLGPLHEPQFRRLFLGRVVSMLGNTIAPVGLAFAILRLTGSKSDLGIVLAARQIPQVVFILFGGVVSDRLPRHRVMVGSSLLSGASQGAVALLLLTGHAQLWHVAALAAVNGTSSAFFFPASQGILPQLVPGEELQKANALLRLGMNACQIVGPAIGGLLVAVTAPGWALAVDAVSFALGAVFVAGLDLPGRVPSGTSMLSELHDGWREFRARTWLWAIVLQFSLVNAAAAGVTQVLGPVQAEQHLGGAGPYGLILAFGAAGYVGGGIVMLRFRPERILLVATLGVFAEVPLLALWGIPAPVAVLAAANFVLGLGIETFGVLWDTAMQQQIPGEKLSRLYAYDMLGSIALTPLGLAIVGPVAGAVGVQATCWGAAALVAVATLAVLLSRDVRRLRRTD